MGAASAIYIFVDYASYKNNKNEKKNYNESEICVFNNIIFSLLYFYIYCYL